MNRIITFLFIAVCILGYTDLRAQHGTYAQANHMPFTASTKTFTYLSGGTVLPSTFNADEQMTAVPIGFTFNFCNANYNTVYASTNGWVSFKNVIFSAGWYNNNSSTVHRDSVVPALFPYWDNLAGSTTATTSTASYRTTGSAPTRVFTLEFRNWRFASGAGPSLTFQVILHENGGNNRIEFMYAQEATAATGNGATIGIARYGNEFSCLGNASATPPQHLSTFQSTYATNITARPATGQSYMWGSIVNISSLPVNRIVCAGANTTFSITSNNTVYYRWQVDMGTGFQNITNNATYSGSTTSTLTVSNVQPTMNNYKYRCMLGSTLTEGVKTTSATLYVNSQLTSQPISNTVCESVPAIFSTSAIGVGLTYKWQVNAGSGFVDIVNGPDYSGVLTNTLTVTNPSGGMNGFLYMCIVNSSCGTNHTTNFATLNVKTIPVITNTLVDQTMCTGQFITFSVDANGSDITYQWQENTGSGFTNLSNSSIYSGVTTKTLKITNLATYMSGYQYRCVVSGACGSPAVSNNAMLTVNLLTKILTEPVESTTVCDSTDIRLSVKAEGVNLGYQWQESINNAPYLNVSNFGIFSGAFTDTLTITDPTSAVSGRKYRCMVSGDCGVSIYSQPSSTTINPLTEITLDPVDNSVEELNVASFTAAALGKNLTYQWQATDGNSTWENVFDNFAYNGTKTVQLNVTGTYLDKDGYKYRCVVSGLCGKNDTSAEAILTVTPKPNSVAHVAQNGNITISPNPVSGSDLTLKMGNTTSNIITVNIFDQLGRTVSENNLTLSSKNDAIINVSQLAPGVYNMQITDMQYHSINMLKFTKY